MKKILGLLLVACVVLSGVAFADTVSGKVSSVDSAANTLVVAKTDAATGAVENVTVAADAATAYTGVASLAEVQVGSDVEVEASKDEATGALKASSVKVVVAEAAPAEEAPVM